MEDLVPAFGDMDSLITDIADAFLYSGGKAEVFKSSFNTVMSDTFSALAETAGGFENFEAIADKALDTGKITFWDEKWGLWNTKTIRNLDDVESAIGMAIGKTGKFIQAMDDDIDVGMKYYEDYTGVIKDWGVVAGGTHDSISKDLRRHIVDTYNVTVSEKEMYEVMKKTPEERQKWLDKIMHSDAAITFQMDKQTNALKAQTEQLSKITEALHPYLEFMRTLNELAALSALSTDELNSGLKSINDTLVNLGKALSTFDLRPVMESLFGTKIAPGEFTGGITTAFTDTMKDYATPFSTLIGYVERLSNSVLTLVSSFDALANISESVLTDQAKLKDILEGLTDVFSNFNLAMGGGEGEWGFAQKIADGIDDMLKSATPLVLYFQKNNAAIDLFNTTLKTFTSILKTVTDAMDMLKRMSEMVLPEITELERGFNNTGEAISRFTDAVSTSFAGVKIDLEDLDTEWAKHEEGIDKLMKSFGQATDTISILATKIVTLTGSLKELRDMSVLSMYDIDRAMKKIPDFLGNFVKALALNMYDIAESLKELDTEWVNYADDMKATMPAYEDATDKISKLISPILSLSSALKQLAEMGTISSTEFDKGFASLMSTISNFAVSLGRNVDGLIVSLQTLRDVWMANEAVLFPLIRDFAIITDNLWGVAHNANRMAEEFKTLSKNTGTLEKGFKDLIGFIDQVVKSTKEFYTPEAAAELAGYITDVGKVIDAFVDLEIGLRRAMDKIRTAIGTAVDAMENKISSLADLAKSAYYWGANMMDGFIVGIYSQFGELELALMRMAALVKAHLGVSSNTERGALSHLTDWGPNLVKTYADGINSEMHTLDDSFASMAPSMAAGTGMAGGTNNVNLYVTQNIGSQADADYANQGLERLLQRHSVM
jgi:methyl-accepting chemotaxis protein